MYNITKHFKMKGKAVENCNLHICMKIAIIYTVESLLYFAENPKSPYAEPKPPILSGAKNGRTVG